MKLEPRSITGQNLREFSFLSGKSDANLSNQSCANSRLVFKRDSVNSRSPELRRVHQSNDDDLISIFFARNLFQGEHFKVGVEMEMHPPRGRRVEDRGASPTIQVRRDGCGILMHRDGGGGVSRWRLSRS